MKRAVLMLCFVLLTGCATTNSPAPTEVPETSKIDAIPFAEEQLYAAAYLGYQETEKLAFFTETYLDSENLPTHYISDGEFYLIIPRYSDMTLRLYRNDFETSERILIYEDPQCRPFLLQCNVSDIMADVTIELTFQSEVVEFSPYISLESGNVQVGEKGLNLTLTE